VSTGSGSWTENAINKQKIALVVVIVFFGFWMFNDPSGLADTAQSAGGTTWDKSTELFTAVIDFLREF
jgi:hypothetical protein